MKLANGMISEDPVHLASTGSGPLDGLNFAIKDVMAIAGHHTGCGHPLWRESHPPALATSPLIEQLLAAGATLTGKTHTDELTYSLAGSNVHYGTPPNPAVPGATAGGSSSGSASVVAAGLVDFAMGSDTGGSIRVPASYCGIYGLRPSHGALTYQHCAQLARSFDCLGWFARDGETMERIGKVLLPASEHRLQRLLLVSNVREEAGEAVLGPFNNWLTLSRLPLPCDGWQALPPLADFANDLRTLQAFEAWQEYGSWISRHQPQFGPGVKERFANASLVSVADATAAQNRLGVLRGQLNALLGDDCVLCLPTAPSPAIALTASDEEIEQIRLATQRMTAIAGVGGLPQVSVPLLQTAGGPVGVSLIGPRGSDCALLALARQLS